MVKSFFRFHALIFLLHLFCASWGNAGIVVISHASFKIPSDRLDKAVLARLYTGRLVLLDGIPVQPINLEPGNSNRLYFIKNILQQTDDEYIAYWLVRKAIGKGMPPLEVNGQEEMINIIRATPNSIGYVDEKQGVLGVRILLTIP